MASQIMTSRFQQLSKSSQAFVLITPAILFAVGATALRSYQPAFFFSSRKTMTDSHTTSVASTKPNNNLDNKEQKEEKFWTGISEKYSKQDISDEETYLKKLSITREHFTKESRVFEFGCGTGSTALLHAPYVKHIDATDISSGMIDIAKAKAKEQGITNVHFEQSSLDKISMNEKLDRYDVVLGLNILHLLPNPDQAISKVAKLLKPGGVFASSTVLIGDYAGNQVIAGLFQFLARGIGLFGFPQSLQVMTGEQLKESLFKAGFEIEEEFRGESKKGMAPYCVFIVARKKE